MTLSRIPHHRRTVLLEHRLPDGGVHFDWLVGPEGVAGDADPDRRDVITFRTGTRIDRLDHGVFDALPLDEHRRLYLDYEGDIGGGRGTVRRVAAGWALAVRHEVGRFELEADFGIGGRPLAGRATGGAWVFRVLPVDR